MELIFFFICFFVDNMVGSITELIRVKGKSVSLLLHPGRP